MRHAHHAPLATHLVDAVEQELREAHASFDLAEHRFGKETLRLRGKPGSKHALSKQRLHEQLTPAVRRSQGSYGVITLPR